MNNLHPVFRMPAPRAFAQIEAEAQADAAAITRAPRNLADPAEVEARRERIASAQRREVTRLTKMMNARHVIRTEGIRTPFEFLAQLQNTLAATPDQPGSILSRYRSMLSDLAVAIEDDLQGDA